MDAALDVPVAIPGTAFVTPPDRLCKASEMASATGYAGSQAWGKVRDLIVDRKQGCAVLAVVNHGATVGLGGTDHLIRATELKACQDQDGKRALCSERTPAQLDAGAKFERPKVGAVDAAIAESLLQKPAN